MPVRLDAGVRRLVDLRIGDSLEVLRTLEAESIDALVTDPPAGIRFMGKTWDTDHGGRAGWCTAMTVIFGECWRVMKPGAHGVVWALPRTSHWTATALEDAGFEVRDVITHHFGSGFPKSLDVSKAIDRAAQPNIETGRRIAAVGEVIRKLPVTAPATDAAKQWQGWGTALKPASEHWILVRKPLAKPTVASQVLATGTGALNIDGSRVGTADNLNGGAYSGQYRAPEAVIYSRFNRGIGEYQAPPGRFPANLVLSHAEGCREVGVRKVRTGAAVRRNIGHSTSAGEISYARGSRDSEIREDVTYASDGTETVTAWECVEGGCPVAELDRQSGNRPGMGRGRIFRRGATTGAGMGYGSSSPQDSYFFDGYGDSGGASRFFYTAKASTSERSMGLPPGLRNTHVTVKPVALMRYLARLITPPGGTILDPFAGSGTTGVAATLEGFNAVLIERDAEWEPVIKARVAWAGHQAGLDGPDSHVQIDLLDAITERSTS